MANQAVYGIISSRAKAEQIIQALVNVGVNSQDISFLSSQGKEFQEFSNGTSNLSSSNLSSEFNRNWRTEDRLTDYPSSGTALPKENLGTTSGKSSMSNGQQQRHQEGGLGTEKHTKAPEGTTTGAVTGGLIGGTLGLLAGIGALAIPGLGPFIAAGPLMATLAGIGSGGTLGGIIGALAGMGIPEYEAKRYENHLKEGGILLAVRAQSDDLAKMIKDTLQKNGAEDVSVSSEAHTSKNYDKH